MLLRHLLTDDEIEVFWQNKKAVSHLGEYLAETIDWDTHWSTKITLKMFNENYRAAHMWPSQWYELLCCKNVMKLWEKLFKNISVNLSAPQRTRGLHVMPPSFLIVQWTS